MPPLALALAITNAKSSSSSTGIAATIEVYTNDNGNDLLQGYRSAFWFASCVSFAGFLLVLAVVRVRGGHGHQQVEEKEGESPKTGSLEA